MTIEKKDIERKVVAIVAEVTERPEDSLGPATRLSGDLELDSLDYITIVAELEDAFGSSIKEKASDLKTLGDIVEYIAENAAKATP